jgi:ribosomal protein L11 methylase PrmA
LDLASELLPVRSRFSFSILTHIHLHAKSQKYFADKTISKKQHRISRLSFLGLIDSLESAIKKLKWKHGHTEWGTYYDDTNYSSGAFDHKQKIISEFLDEINPKSVWDLGANDGYFSRIASRKGIQTVSFDIDPVTVEKNYIKSIKEEEKNILPLLLDLTNPSPNIGWENRERMSLKKRRSAETVLALALIHHLAISNNLPFNKIARFFSKICRSLIIEFVPKNDSQVQRLLATREDIFPDYTQQTFEEEFSKYFTILRSERIQESQRILYLMQTNE